MNSSMCFEAWTLALNHPFLNFCSLFSYRNRRSSPSLRSLALLLFGWVFFRTETTGLRNSSLGRALSFGRSWTLWTWLRTIWIWAWREQCRRRWSDWGRAWNGWEHFLFGQRCLRSCHISSWYSRPFGRVSPSSVSTESYLMIFVFPLERKIPNPIPRP